MSTTLPEHLEHIGAPFIALPALAIPRLASSNNHGDYEGDRLTQLYIDHILYGPKSKERFYLSFIVECKGLF